VSIRTANIIAAVCAVLAVAVVAAGEVFGETPERLLDWVLPEAAPAEYTIAPAEPGRVTITITGADCAHMPPGSEIVEGVRIVQGLVAAYGEGHPITFTAPVYGQHTYFVLGLGPAHDYAARTMFFGQQADGPVIRMAKRSDAKQTAVLAEISDRLAAIEAASLPVYGPEPLPVLNINTATREELMQIDGVGEVTADRIIQFRPYAAVEDLADLYRVTESTIAKWQEQFELTI